MILGERISWVVGVELSRVHRRRICIPTHICFLQVLKKHPKV